jgi:hypothetical protein
MGSFNAVDSHYTPPIIDLAEAGEYLSLIDPITKLAVVPRIPKPSLNTLPSGWQRTPAPEHVRIELAEEQDNRCDYCCRSLIGISNHVDHKEPLSRGGDDHMDNYCMTCSRCNISKGIRSVMDFSLRMLSTDR